MYSTHALTRLCRNDICRFVIMASVTWGCCHSGSMRRASIARRRGAFCVNVSLKTLLFTTGKQDRLRVRKRRISYMGEDDRVAWNNITGILHTFNFSSVLAPHYSYNLYNCSVTMLTKFETKSARVKGMCSPNSVSIGAKGRELTLSGSVLYF